MISGVIFDFNGTLFFDGEKHKSAWMEIAKQLHASPLSDDDLKKHMHGQRNKAVIEYILKQKIDVQTSESISREKERIYRSLCRKDASFMHLVEGSVTLFTALQSRNIPISIATASIKENVDFFIESFNLNRWFPKDHIIYDDGTYHDKRDMFIKAAERMNVCISDTAIFEDSISGIRFAYECGCRHIYAICDEEKKEEYLALPGVCKTLQTYKDFPIEELLGETL